MANEIDDVERPDDVIHVAGRPAPETNDQDDNDDLVEIQEVELTPGNKAKVVKLEALQEARRQSKGYRDTIAKLEPLMPEFNEFLNQKRNGGRKAAEPAARPAVPDETPEELEELAAVAHTMGYVDPATGDPDLVRTRAVMKMLDRRAGRVVSERVAPLAGNLAADRARQNREDAYSRAFVDGRPVAEQEFIDMAFDSLPAEYTADPLVAGTAHLVAAGLQYLEERKQAAGGVRRGTGPVQFTRRGTPAFRGREPFFSEGSTGRVRGDHEETLTAFSEAAARARGKTPEQWQKSRERVNSRRDNNILDDIY